MGTSFFSSLPDRHRLGCAELRARKNVTIMLVWAAAVVVIVYALWHFLLSSLPIPCPVPSRGACFFIGFGVGFVACGYFYDQMIKEFHRSLRRSVHEP